MWCQIGFRVGGDRPPHPPVDGLQGGKYGVVLVPLFFGHQDPQALPGLLPVCGQVGLPLHLHMHCLKRFDLSVLRVCGEP